MTTICHNGLRLIYLKDNNPEAHRYHYEKTLESFEAIKPTHPGIEIDTILELLKMTSAEQCSSVEIRCRKRLLEIATTPEVSPRFSWLCYQALSRLCYEAKDYKSALEYFRVLNKSNGTGNAESLALLFGIVRCSVILGRPRLFYASISELAKCDNFQSCSVLSFLQERREYIKMYMIQGSCPENCKLLKRILEVLEHGISEEDGAQPLKRKVIGLAFAKKLRVHMLCQKGSSSHKINSLVKTMKMWLG